MSHLAVIIPLPSSFIPLLSLLKMVECQWQDAQNAYLPLRWIGSCDDRVLLEEIDYELSRLEWPVFSCVVKHVTFQNSHEGYKLGLTLASSPSLITLCQKVTFALHRAGLETPRKKFVPFIELGFMQAGQEHLLKNWINQHALFPFPAFDVEHISLIEDYSAQTYSPLSFLANYSFNRTRLPNINQEHWTE